MKPIFCSNIHDFVRYQGNRCLMLLALLSGILSTPIATGIDYAPTSVLAEGKWVKVSVNQSGLHFIGNTQLSSMGFTDPSKVEIYGYGGRRLPDVLSPSTYIDDLPHVAAHKTDRGIFFYAVGPESQFTDAFGNINVSNNPFSDLGFYFLTQEDRDNTAEIPHTGYPGVTNGIPATTFTQVLHHEIDAYSPGETGHYLVGEDMKYTSARSFGFELLDIAAGEVNVGISMMTNLVSGAAFTIESSWGESKTVALPYTPSTNYQHGNATTSWMTLDNTGNQSLTLTVTLGGGIENVRKAHLDYLTINYPRHIRIPANASWLAFNSFSPAVSIENASGNTIVWDVTNPIDIKYIAHTDPDDSSKIYFTSNLSGNRDYIAFNPSNTADVPGPVFVEEVPNQDLHGTVDAEMIIFTSSMTEKAAQRLAAFRKSNNALTVAVVEQGKVFNEFSSGSPDVNAFRKLLKMLFDRGRNGQGTVPRYALLMGRSTFDNRRLTAATKNLSYVTLPMWQTDEGLNDNTSYPTDDILGFLEDESGENMERDTLCIAIGRLPVISEPQAELLVNKIIEYETETTPGQWQTKAIFIADDDDNGVHMQQTEQMLDALEQNGGCNTFLPEKIYLDTYDYINGTAVEARNEFYRNLDEGTLWINYVGHASSTALSGEGILNYSDVSSLFLKKIPFIYAATCDFMRWDASAISGAELLASTKGGGVIGAISATRPVYIVQNGILTKEMGNLMGRRQADGTSLTIGEMLKMTKNAVGKDDNKLRYALLGDPSMHLRIPHYKVIIDTVDGAPFVPEEADVVFQARQDFMATGHIADPVSGEPVENFNGIITSTLYDADVSLTTQGHGNNGIEFTFDRHGERLFAGADTVVDGRFKLHIAMPSEVADNYRNATLTLLAVDNNGLEASTVERRLYVYGFDDDAIPDTVPPVIEEMFLNHPDFRDGNIVNASPTLIAKVSDNHSINLSMAGIGHWMSLSLDNGDVTYSDVSNYYQPESIDKGTIYYPLKNLTDGAHSLTLRIWDASGNSTQQTITFFVDSYAPIRVLDIYVDHSPASETANFYLVHDRPDSDLNVQLMVYDVMGRQVWRNVSTGRADRYISFPIVWNLKDLGGHRVPRGIYLFKAVVTELGQNMNLSTPVMTPTRKMAVTSR